MSTPAEDALRRQITEHSRAWMKLVRESLRGPDNNEWRAQAQFHDDEMKRLRLELEASRLTSEERPE